MNASSVLISERRENPEQTGHPSLALQEEYSRDERPVDAQVSQPSPPILLLDAHRLAAARSEAASRAVPVISILEETLECEPEQLIAELGRLLRMPVLTMEKLRASTPAFEILPFSEATKK